MSVYAVVAFYQYRENYGDANDQYWKNKGGVECVVKDGLPLSEVLDLQERGLEELVEKSEYGSYYNNDYAEYTLQKWELVELNEHRVKEIYTLLKRADEDEDFGYVRYCHSCEHVFDWAANELIERGILTVEGSKYGYQSFTLKEDDMLYLEEYTGGHGAIE